MTSKNLRAAVWVVSAAISVFGCFGDALAVVGDNDSQATRIHSTELQVLGPVEQISLVRGMVRIAGQPVSFTKKTTFVYNGVVVKGTIQALQMIHVGDLVAAYGPIGAQPTSVTRLGTQYVPGATRVVVQGRIDSVDSSVGLAHINGLVIDYTSAMANTKFAGINVGDVVRVSGIQPNLGGQLLVDTLSNPQLGQTSARSSIIGTGSTRTVRSIIGTGTNSIIGTGSTRTVR